MKLLEQLNEKLSPVLDRIRKQILGANNERVDFIMDSFYKLTPKQQTGALGALGLFTLGLMAGVFYVYISRINALEYELDSGYKTIQNLRQLAVEYNNEKKRFDWLVTNIEQKTSSLRPKPFFERASNQIGVTLTSLRTQEVELPLDNILAKDFTHVSVEFGMPKVSIPRMLKFLGEVEKSDKHLYVKNLDIRARYGDKLYFDTEAKILGVKTKNN